MGFKLGGFVCNKCVVFSEYTTYKGDLEFAPKIPVGWTVFSNQRVIDNYVISNGSELVIYCDKCYRALKINKISHDIKKKSKNDKY
jgi:hypothetical protein